VQGVISTNASMWRNYYDFAADTAVAVITTWEPVFGRAPLCHHRTSALAYKCWNTFR